jgi:hypothetical protein
MSVTILSASLDQQALNLALGIVGHFLQSVGCNIRLDNAVSPSLIGVDVSAQQSCKK